MENGNRDLWLPRDHVRHMLGDECDAYRAVWWNSHEMGRRETGP